MPSPTSSLLQHLLTRSDLERLAIPVSQVEQWLVAKALEPIAQPATAAAAEGEQVFSVPDADLRDDLEGRLAAVGKPTVLLSPERIRSFLQRTARGDSPEHAATDPATAVADELPDGDLAEMLSAAIAALDADMEVVLQLAEADAAATAGADAAVTEESLLLDEPIEPGANSESDWFDAGELEAAMGELAPEPAADFQPEEAAMKAAPTEAPFAPPVPVATDAPPPPATARAPEVEAELVPQIESEAQVAAAAPPVEPDATAPVPAAAVAALAAGLEAQAADLGALATMVATHGAQLQRFEGLHEAIGSLQQQVTELRAAAAAAAETPSARTEPVAPPIPEPPTEPKPEPATAPATADVTKVVGDGRRTSLMALGLALMCWSGLIWFGTGSATLALVSFVAANVIGFLALQPTRER